MTNGLNLLNIFPYIINHKKGMDNVIFDALSR